MKLWRVLLPLPTPYYGSFRHCFRTSIGANRRKYTNKKWQSQLVLSMDTKRPSNALGMGTVGLDKKNPLAGSEEKVSAIYSVGRKEQGEETGSRNVLWPLPAVYALKVATFQRNVKYKCSTFALFPSSILL